MKKPLTKSVIKNEDVEEKPIDDDTKVLALHSESKFQKKCNNCNIGPENLKKVQAKKIVSNQWN